MKKTMLLSFVVLGATAFAASNTFKVNLSQDSVIEGKTVKAGAYKISMENGNAVLRQGKQSIEVPAREETEPAKAPTTEVTYKDNRNVQEIRVGGSTTKIVFEGFTPMNSGS